MSRLIFVISITCMIATGLAAQVRGTSPSTTLSPANTAAKSAKTGSAPAVTPRSTDRAGTGQSTQNRTGGNTTTYGNTTSRQSVTGQYNRPSDRPAVYAPPTSTNRNNEFTSKGVSKGAPAARGTVQWMTLEQALEKSKTEKRKIFVDMYTDWCGWCKHMDSTTFVNPAVARYLNEHYYPVKFNAEQDKDIVFKDKTYKFKKTGARGYHELAALWLNNRLSFPTVVFLDENQQVIQPVPGYQDAVKMEAIINYFGTDSHKKTPWETYEKQFSANRK